MIQEKTGWKRRATEKVQNKSYVEKKQEFWRQKDTLMGEKNCEEIIWFCWCLDSNRGPPKPGVEINPQDHKTTALPRPFVFLYISLCFFFVPFYQSVNFFSFSVSFSNLLSLFLASNLFSLLWWQQKLSSKKQL